MIEQWKKRVVGKKISKGGMQNIFCGQKIPTSPRRFIRAGTSKNDVEITSEQDQNNLKKGLKNRVITSSRMRRGKIKEIIWAADHVRKSNTLLSIEENWAARLLGNP